MIIKTHQDKIFQPFTLEIKFETQSELVEFIEILNYVEAASLIGQAEHIKKQIVDNAIFI